MINKIWIRIGDQDDYHEFDNVLEASEELAEIVGHKSLKAERYHGLALRGVCLKDVGLVGNNGVSFFWGDEDAEFIREISNDELGVLNSTLDERV